MEILVFAKIAALMQVFFPHGFFLLEIALSPYANYAFRQGEEKKASQGAQFHEKNDIKRENKSPQLVWSSDEAVFILH